MKKQPHSLSLSLNHLPPVRFPPSYNSFWVSWSISTKFNRQVEVSEILHSYKLSENKTEERRRYPIYVSTERLQWARRLLDIRKPVWEKDLVNVSVTENLQSLLVKHLRQSTLRNKSTGNPAYLIPSHENN